MFLKSRVNMNYKIIIAILFIVIVLISLSLFLFRDSEGKKMFINAFNANLLIRPDIALNICSKFDGINQIKMKRSDILKMNLECAYSKARVDINVDLSELNKYRISKRNELCNIDKWHCVFDEYRWKMFECIYHHKKITEKQISCIKKNVIDVVNRNEFCVNANIDDCKSIQSHINFYFSKSFFKY